MITSVAPRSALIRVAVLWTVSVLSLLVAWLAGPRAVVGGLLVASGLIGLYSALRSRMADTRMPDMEAARPAHSRPTGGDGGTFPLRRAAVGSSPRRRPQRLADGGVFPVRPSFRRGGSMTGHPNDNT